LLKPRWWKVGETLESSPFRIYLAGRICVESARQVADESWFSSKQGRLLFAYLVCERTRPVPREELAELLWPGELPPAWDSALRSLISKLRQFLGRIVWSTGRTSISSQFGCYQLHLPPDTWIDLEVAQHSVDEAEGALRSQDVRTAWGPTNVVVVIADAPSCPEKMGPGLKGNGESFEIS
jgi:two-component SAPR family response regulator